MAREEVLHQRDRPLLECLRKDSVVGVAESLLDNCTTLARPCNVYLLLTAPGIVPLQALNIDQYSLKLRDGKRWVGVVELDSDLVREFAPGPLALLETANNVVERSSAPEVLLLQTELLATVQTILVRMNTKMP